MHAAILGGNWNNGVNAGSRSSNWNNYPWNSNDNIGARGRCDDPFMLGGAPRPRRQATARQVVSSIHPASANTLMDSGERGVVRRNPRPINRMAKKYRNLIDKITSDENMRRAYRLTAKGKRSSLGFLSFKEYSELNLYNLAQSIRDGSYRPGQERAFTVYEPKPRQITAASFTDRIAHHALVGVIGPIFEATLLPRTFACRDGMGTHAGVTMLQSDLRRMGSPTYVLKTDFKKYFASIDRGVLNQIIRRKISCARTLALIETMTPPSGVGIPIGALTSQLYANIYAGEIDRRLQCELGVKHWYRYMDDIVVLSRDIDHLRYVQQDLAHIAHNSLRLSFSRWSVQPASRGVNFLGYRVWPTHKLLRKSSVTRARRAIKTLRRNGNDDRLTKFLAAWTGHAGWADTHNLLSKLGVM
jgi:hypothetical protein